MKEEWRYIYGTENNYSVSNKGRIKSEPRMGTNGGVLKPRIGKSKHLKTFGSNSKGQARVLLMVEGKHRNYAVRELMKCYWPSIYFGE